jgi:hypothetical protein
MNYNLLDLLFSAPTYTGMSTCMEFNGLIDPTKFHQCFLDWIADEPTLPQVPPLSKVSEIDEELNLENINKASSYVLLVRSGDHSPWAYHLVSTPIKSYLFLSMSHQLGDGVSLMFLIQNLSELYSNRPLTKFNYDRSILEKAIKNISIEDSHNVELTQTGMTAEQDYEALTLGDVKLLPKQYVSKEQINEINIDNSCTPIEIITAIILKEKGTSNDIILPFNLRGRKFGIDPLFFGNAVKAETISISSDEIKNLSLLELAKKVKSIKSLSTPQNLAKSYQLLQSVENHYGVQGLQRLRITNEQSILITDLTKLPIGIPFGDTSVKNMAMFSPYLKAAAILKTENGYAYQLAARANEN